MKLMIQRKYKNGKFNKYIKIFKEGKKILSNKFGDAMQQKNISKALEIKVRQDSICDEIINVYDSMIKLQNNE